MNKTIGRDRVRKCRFEVAVDISHPEQEGRRAARLDRLLERSLHDLVELGVVAVEHLAVADYCLHFGRRELPSHPPRLAKRNDARAFPLGRADGVYLLIEFCRKRIGIAIVALQTVEYLLQGAPNRPADRRNGFTTRGTYYGHYQCDRNAQKNSASHLFYDL